jgi:iron(III) transport system ATP-binding protein
MSRIKVEQLFHTYQDRGRQVVAVDHIDFDVAENEFFTLLGPSGCGKTSTLRCLAGLEVPTSGTITLGDVVVFSSRGIVPTRKRDIGMVFQDYAVWPHMSVFENVAFPLRVAKKKMSSTAIKDRVHEALELVNMTEYVDRLATQLSGGQQQRLSLARALVRQPKVLLLDEPLSNLDAKLREQMRKELRFIQRRIKLTTIFVTHDQVEALSMSNRVAVMQKGVIAQVGTPREIYQTPKSEFVASFIGATTFFRGRVSSADPAAGTVTLSTSVGDLVCLTDEPPEVGSAATAAIRPESIRVCERETPGMNNIAGTVEIGLFIGEAVDYHVVVGDELVRVKGDPHSRFRRHDHVFLEISPSDCVLIPPDRPVGGATAAPLDSPVEPELETA